MHPSDRDRCSARVALPQLRGCFDPLLELIQGIQHDASELAISRPATFIPPFGELLDAQARNPFHHLDRSEVLVAQTRRIGTGQS